MKKSIIICTDISTMLFGVKLIFLFERGFTQISVVKDIDPAEFLANNYNFYFFAYIHSVPPGVEKVVNSLEAFPFNVSLFCNEKEAKRLDAMTIGGLKNPRFESEFDIIDSFVKVLEMTR